MITATACAVAAVFASHEVVYVSLGCFWDKLTRLECVGLPSVDALGTEDYACNSTHNSVSDRVCTPKATVVGYMGGVGNYPSYETNYSKLNYTETIRLQYDPTILSFSKVDYINFFPAVLEEILTTRSWKHIGN